MLGSEPEPWNDLRRSNRTEVRDRLSAVATAPRLEHMDAVCFHRAIIRHTERELPRQVAPTGYLRCIRPASPEQEARRDGTNTAVAPRARELERRPAALWR